MTDAAETSPQSEQRRRNLKANLQAILGIVPERDELLEYDTLRPEFFREIGGGISFQLVIMQLSFFDARLSQTARSSVARLLQDPDFEQTMVFRIFASDLIQAAPVQKSHSKATLVRDVLVIAAILILQKLGTEPTKNEGTGSDRISGSQYVFEHLVGRGLEFADSAKTIEKIWTRRYERFEKLGLNL